MKTSIQTRLLKAALTCAADSKETRYYLHGVLLDFISKDGVVDHCNIVSTNGNMLFAARNPVEWEPDEGIPATDTVQVIIPANTVKAALLGVGKRETLDFESLPGGQYRLGGTIFDPIAWKFPLYAKVIPVTVSGEDAQFDADLVQKGQNAIRIANKTKRAVFLHKNGGGAAIMQCKYISAVVVLMPYCDKDPAWATFYGFTV